MALNGVYLMDVLPNVVFLGDCRCTRLGQERQRDHLKPNQIPKKRPDFSITSHQSTPGKEFRAPLSTARSKTGVESFALRVQRGTLRP